jgi:cobalt/nickel transport system ATP-binding protein
MSRSDDSEMVYLIDKVSYAYQGRHPALDEVDLKVARGERLVILGANGCGKSTLLKVMDGLIAPTAGHVEAFGENMEGIDWDARRSRQLHRRVGFVFQDADVQLFCPTVWDDVTFGPLQLGLPRETVIDRANRALGEMEVADLSDRAPYELNEGQKKRVAIATVLAMESEVLLLDEPTANLDPRTKAGLLSLIVRLNEAGRTLVITTQELEIVPIVATRAVVFGQKEKRPIAGGSPSEILGDVDLLVAANLVHEHLHWHGDFAHRNAHLHGGIRTHSHGASCDSPRYLKEAAD